MKRARLSSLVSSLKRSLTLLHPANVIATGRGKVSWVRHRKEEIRAGRGRRKGGRKPIEGV